MRASRGHKKTLLRFLEQGIRNEYYKLLKVGANRGDRTPDLLITNQLLYQLSYVGLKL